MIKISALEHCFLIFPQFRKDFDILKKANVLIHIDDDHCEWKLNNHCLMDYFFEMDADHTIYGNLIWDFLKSVETLFDMEHGIFDKINYENIPDPSPEDYKQLKTILYQGRYAEFEMPKEIIDFSYYRNCITNPCKFLNKAGEPDFADYVITFVSCLKQFAIVWEMIIDKTDVGYLENYFGKSLSDVYCEKETELTEIFIKCIVKKFPNSNHKIKLDELEKTLSSGLKKMDKKLAVYMKEITPKPKYIQELINGGNLMPDGKTCVHSLDSVAQALVANNIEINAKLLSQFIQPNGDEYALKTRIEVANRVKNSKP